MRDAFPRGSVSLQKIDDVVDDALRLLANICSAGQKHVSSCPGAGPPADALFGPWWFPRAVADR